MFLDNNHPPDDIENALKIIEKSQLEGCIIKKLYLIPNIMNPIKNYPISYHFILKSFYNY